ncbi:hypothetical protein [Coraliomargarita parva]|uniref:hypothetical protein n=1 Tax=Coraliomargarita parva TaxID=3014050 RepID=UPI0022B4D9A0|nr:hypothetical protein [Coraliomargarita parva]
MKNNLLILPLTCCALSSLPAQSLIVNFNGSTVAGTEHFYSPTDGDVVWGSDTLNFDFENFQDSSSTGNHAGVFDNDGSTFGETGVSYFFVRDQTVDSTGITATLTISGFSGDNYKLELISSVYSDTGVRLADIQVNGSFADSGGGVALYGDDYNAYTDGFLTGTPLTWNNVVPTGVSNDTITLTVATSGQDLMGFINGLRITVIPEPATMGLFIGLGLIPCCMLARNRKYR